MGRLWKNAPPSSELRPLPVQPGQPFLIMKPKRLVVVGGVAGGASAAARARRLCEQKRLKALLLDVRTPAEFEEAHIDGSVLMPLGDLNTEEVKRLAASKSACLLICRSGNRARQAGYNPFF